MIQMLAITQQQNDTSPQQCAQPCANRENPGYKEDSNNGFSNICKLRADVSSCIMFTFSSFKVATKQHSQYEGALLLEIKNNNTNEFDEVWVPKKLCCNLDLELGTVYVWEVFAEDKLVEYITSSTEEG